VIDFTHSNISSLLNWVTEPISREVVGKICHNKSKQRRTCILKIGKRRNYYLLAMSRVGDQVFGFKLEFITSSFNKFYAISILLIISTVSIY